METRKKQNNGEKTSPDPTRIVEEGPSDESDDPTPSTAQSTKRSCHFVFPKMRTL